jgi:predicted component of type VI protein secretion system
LPAIEQIQPSKSEEAPIAAVQGRQPQHLPLAMHIGGRVISITRQAVLGRNGDLALDAFAGVREVSRRHCLLEPRNESWWLKHLSEHSPTKLDGSEIPLHEQRQLKPGENRVILGDVLSFILQVGRPVVQEASQDSAEEDGYPDPFAGMPRSAVANPSATVPDRREGTK